MYHTLKLINFLKNNKEEYDLIYNLYNLNQLAFPRIQNIKHKIYYDPDILNNLRKEWGIYIENDRDILFHLNHIYNIIQDPMIKDAINFILYDDKFSVNDFLFLSSKYTDFYDVFEQMYNKTSDI